MIQVGQTTASDPILAYSSVAASHLLQQAVQRPATVRLAWLRTELNKATPGMGDAFVSKMRELKRRGRTANQASFDALRLAFANQIHTKLDKLAERRGLSGLGTSEADINAVFCGITGVTTAGGSILTSAMSNPAGSAAVGQAGAAALQAQGCNTAALQAQARIAEAQAAQAAALAAAQGGATVSASGGAIGWIVGGVGLLGVLGLVGYMALKKR